jgi:hypothetical protein
LIDYNDNESIGDCDDPMIQIEKSFQPRIGILEVFFMNGSSHVLFRIIGKAMAVFHKANQKCNCVMKSFQHVKLLPLKTANFAYILHFTGRMERNFL